MPEYSYRVVYLSRDMPRDVARRILTDHAEFDYPRTLAASRLVIDTRNATFGLPAPAGRVVRL